MGRIFKEKTVLSNDTTAMYVLIVSSGFAVGILGHFFIYLYIWHKRHTFLK